MPDTDSDGEYCGESLPGSNAYVFAPLLPSSGVVATPSSGRCTAGNCGACELGRLVPLTCELPWAQTDISTDTTIPAGCYLVNNTITVHKNATLTLAPGVRLQFAAGSAASPIVLTGQQNTRGYWNGLELDDSNSMNNVLDYVTIEYAGGGGAYYSADLTVWGVARIQVGHCTIRHSESWGIGVHQNATVNGDVATVNTYADNVLGDVGP